jgi:hypothetical protein
MLFFQTTLLAGYLYAHESTRRVGVRRQAVVHLGVVLLPLLVLPVAVPDGAHPAPRDRSPAARRELRELMSTQTTTKSRRCRPHTVTGRGRRKDERTTRRSGAPR